MASVLLGSQSEETLLCIREFKVPWGCSVGSEMLLNELYDSRIHNLLPFNGNFSFGKSQKSQGAKSGL
jgi:hypothetical protein